MLWKLFGSEQKINEALEQSQGYDISFVDFPTPANTDTPPKAETSSNSTLLLWKDYSYPKEKQHDDQSDFWDQKTQVR